MKFLQSFFEAYNVPVLDMLIDDDGNLYSGKIDGYPIMKGNVHYKKGKIDYIIGKDSKKYPAGLDKNGNIKSVNTDRNGYTLKLYKHGSVKLFTATQKAEINNDILDALTDYYVICIKYPERIEIYLLSGDQNSDNYVLKHTTDGFDVSPTSMKSDAVPKYSIDTLNIEANIENISLGLKASLDSMYQELSKFQYNLETIITGTNEDGEIIDGEGFEEISNNAKANVMSMRGKLRALVRDVTGMG
jgi:hypothetical protein